MNTRAGKPVSPEFETKVRQILQDAVTENSLRSLRALGLNKIACITALRDYKQIPLAEGKQIVHLSSAWADRKESDDTLHEMLEKVVREEFHDSEGSTLREHVA